MFNFKVLTFFLLQIIFGSHLTHFISIAAVVMVEVEVEVEVVVVVGGNGGDDGLSENF